MSGLLGFGLDLLGLMLRRSTDLLPIRRAMLRGLVVETNRNLLLFLFAGGALRRALVCKLSLLPQV